MPITVEGKLDLFKKILFDRVEADWSEKVDNITRTMEQKLEEKKQEFERRKKAIIEDRESRAQVKRKVIISKAQSDSDYEIMKKREELLREMAESLKSWCREFIKGDSYKAFLQKNIEESFRVMKGQNLLLRFTNRDLKDLETFIKEQIQHYGAQRNSEVHALEDEIIGGFTIEDKDSGVIADFTIKTLIDEGKEFMGKLLYERLDEVLKA